MVTWGHEEVTVQSQLVTLKSPESDIADRQSAEAHNPAVIAEARGAASRFGAGAVRPVLARSSPLPQPR